ncbi:MAG: tetratricopeptide repeat protein [Candidatus Neomarinimicrobiota bacterium]
MRYASTTISLLTTLFLSSYLGAALQDTAEQKDSSPGKEEQADLSDIWLNTVWKNIDEITTTKESFDVEKVTTVAGVRGAEAEDEATNELYYRGSMRSPSMEDLKSAIERLEGLIEDDPDGEKAPEFRYYVIQCYLQLGNEDKAGELGEKLLEDHPDSKWAALYKK